MSALAQALPPAARLRLPLSRDQLMLLLAAVNQLFLGLDTYLAHLISGTIRPREWIPILFGPAAGVVLLVAGLLALRWRGPAVLLAFVTLLASIVVGVLGVYYHFIRAILPDAPLSEMVSVSMLVWAPPVLGPLAFAGVGVWGMSAAWVERPAESGRLVLPGGLYVPMPFSKTRGYFFLVGLGILAALVSSVLDHARMGFADPWLWVPTLVGIFCAMAAITAGALPRPDVSDLRVYLAAMVLLIGLGLLGTALHVHGNLVGTTTVVTERFIRGAPFLAPLLFANMGLVGIVAMLPGEEGPAR